MANRVLIVEDQPDYSNQWLQLLTEFFIDTEQLSPEDFIIEQAFSFEEAINKIEDDDFDLVLLDHHLDPSNAGFTGIDVIQCIISDLGENILHNRFVVLSALYDLNVSNQYTRFGALAYLRKPINREQFFITISDAWLKLQLGVARAEWEKADEAIQYLIEEGLLEPLEQIAQQATKQSERADALQHLNDNLLRKLAEVGDSPEMFRAYHEWDEGIRRIAPSSISSIYPELRRYKLTRPFLRDLNYFFRTNLRIFVQLHADLARIRERGDEARLGRQLFENHWEYRIGIRYRLYFRSEGQDKILERFAHHNVQERILDYLRDNTPPIVDNPESFFDPTLPEPIEI